MTSQTLSDREKMTCATPRQIFDLAVILCHRCAVMEGQAMRLCYQWKTDARVHAASQDLQRMCVVTATLAMHSMARLVVRAAVAVVVS